MEIVFNQMVALLAALWWPFCRVMALFSAAPVFGDGTVPIRARVLLSLVLAIVMLPTLHGVAIDPFSLHGVAAAFREAVIGGVIGLAFHLCMAAITVFGYLVSSQMSLSMAVMNDPLNGTSSDVVSSLLSVLCIMVFFAIDGHLMLTGVVGASFRAWPVGVSLDALTLQTVVANIAWVFSAALVLAVPVVFSTLVVQIGFGFLNRIAPSLNLFSLGFSLVTLFGIVMLAGLLRFVPDHFIQMTGKVLEMLEHRMHQVRHG